MYKKIQLLLLCFVLLICALPPQGSAITIDSFEGEQSVSANPPDGQAVFVSAVSGGVGGTRALKVQAFGGSPSVLISSRTSLGTLIHSQDFSVTGRTKITWDGDLIGDNLNPTGLGHVDLLQDGGTALRLQVLGFDYPNNSPIELTFVLYDAADTSGAKFSLASIFLAAQINSPTLIDLPFSNFTQHGPAGAIDFRNVGAVQMFINGQVTPAADLAVNWFGTNGSCQRVPDINGNVLDVCSVCGGDGSSCLDCKGIPFGPAALDLCNVCDGDGKSCLGCVEKNISDIQTKMDGGAKKQEALIKTLAKRLETLSPTKKNLNYTKVLRAKAHQLQVRNWTISWVIPTETRQCTNTSLCINVSNQSYLDEYSEHSEELRKLALEVVNKIKKVTKGLQQTEKAALKKNEQLHKKNIELKNQVPLFQSSCG